MQMHKPICSSSASDHGNQLRGSDNLIDLSATISLKFNQFLRLDQNDHSNSQNPLTESVGDVDEDEFVDCEYGEEDDEEGVDDFTFTYVGENNYRISMDKSFENDQRQHVFPPFDQNLSSGKGGNQLAIQPPVDKVFVESSQRAPLSSTSEHDETEGIATGPYYTWSKRRPTYNPELSKKSNSTGFSKPWNLKGKVGRSNSHVPEAFVFQKSSDRRTSSSKSFAKRTTVEGSSVKGNIFGGGGKEKDVNKGIKAQKTNLSAHEVYLKKREQTEERRRSYLPYRPEIMGFFTNVNCGLSRNVHPY